MAKHVEEFCLLGLHSEQMYDLIYYYPVRVPVRADDNSELFLRYIKTEYCIEPENLYKVEYFDTWQSCLTEALSRVTDTITDYELLLETYNDELEHLKNLQMSCLLQMSSAIGIRPSKSNTLTHKINGGN